MGNANSIMSFNVIRSQYVSSSFFPSLPKNGGYSVELPKPAYLKIREEQEGGGTRSPKYPSTVTKVT